MLSSIRLQPSGSCQSFEGRFEGGGSVLALTRRASRERLRNTATLSSAKRHIVTDHFISDYQARRRPTWQHRWIVVPSRPAIVGWGPFCVTKRSLSGSGSAIQAILLMRIRAVFSRSLVQVGPRPTTESLLSSLLIGVGIRCEILQRLHRHPYERVRIKVTITLAVALSGNGGVGVRAVVSSRLSPERIGRDVINRSARR
jgi:hypothetical protein